MYKVSNNNLTMFYFVSNSIRAFHPFLMRDTIADLTGYQSGLLHWHIVLISIAVGLLSLVTVVGNLLVLISFKVEKRLQTVSNYYILSLAVADLTIGK